MEKYSLSHAGKIALLGFDREGRSTYRFLIRNAKKLWGAGPRPEFWVLDRNPDIRVPRGVRSVLGKGYLNDLSRFDIVFRTPGIPYTNPEITNARKRGTEVSSLTKLFFEHCPATIVGVTGSKGKTTATALLYKLLRAGGKKVYIAGNSRDAALDLLPRLTKDSLVVLELSSFQLHDLDRSPRVAAFLEMFPEHQDAHGSVAEYYRAKGNLAAHQKKTDAVFYFPFNKAAQSAARRGKGKKIAVDPKRFRIFGERDMRIRGAHMWRNAVMAARVAAYLGVPKKIIVATAKKFRGVPHRLEFVRTVRRVSFYEDSASTNPHTTLAAIASFPETYKVVIMGGKDKGLDYKPLAKAIGNKKNLSIVLCGENKEKITRALANALLPLLRARTFEKAVRMAYRDARHHAPAVVILSPGAASFDMFKNYTERGDAFQKIIKRL